MYTPTYYLTDEAPNFKRHKINESESIRNVNNLSKMEIIVRVII